MRYKDFLKVMQEKLSGILDKNKKINIVREELQKIILYSIYSRKTNIYFLGGTNLRICYKLDRFSEDLDFELDLPNKDYKMDDILNYIVKDLKTDNGFDINIKVGNMSIVRKSMIKFSYILYDLGISPLKDEKVTIKLEIDTNPSVGSEYGTKVIKSSFGSCIIKNQDINSTFSGKMGALLLRKYVKGRDYYDLYWYLDNYSHKQFNIKYLGNIIKQYNTTNNKKVLVPKTNKEVLNMVLEKIEKTNYNQIKTDLIRFVNWDKSHLDIFFNSYKEVMYTMIKKYNTNLEEEKKGKKFRL